MGGTHQHRLYGARTSRGVMVIIAGAADGSLSSGVDFVAGRKRELAPDDLARARAPCSRALGERADNLKPAAALVLIGGLPEPGQRRGVIKYLAEKRAFQDEAQADLALRVPNGIGNQFGNDELGYRNELFQAPLAQWPPDQRPAPPGRRQLRSEVPFDVPVSADRPQPGHQASDVLPPMVVIAPGQG